MQPMTEWKLRMAASAAVDAADMLFGMVPILGQGVELLSLPAALALWGWRGGLYGLEMLDVSNVADAFVPTAVIIGWSKRAEYEQRQREWDAQQKPPAPTAPMAPAMVSVK
ncbi:hypothetical protein [Belnapia sp. F-4-1]|uniref:hypothetical protein n=1 Tax=Belnapia sp. F-4-1 TaxID=1545443 RepID=UPI0005BBFA53|nr:hypothetical protein [Belnapia sp. F-4-1]